MVLNQPWKILGLERPLFLAERVVSHDLIINLIFVYIVMLKFLKNQNTRKNKLYDTLAYDML